MARNKKLRNSTSAYKTPRKVNGRTSRVTKPKLNHTRPISERKKKLRVKIKESRKMKLLRERMKMDKIIQKEGTYRSPVRKVILYPPVRPPPGPSMPGDGPSTSAAPKCSSRRVRSVKKPLQPANNADTIVIDSEDESAVFQQQHPLFYVDITGGFNDKEVPKYDKEPTKPVAQEDPSVLVIEESLLEEGELEESDGQGANMQATSDALNKRINEEEIPISEDEDDGDVVDCANVAVPRPKQVDDQSVVFCSEVIDVDREENDKETNQLDFIPIWFDLEGVGRKRKFKRSARKKIFQDLAKQKHPALSNKPRQRGNEDMQLEQMGESSGSNKRFVVIDGNNVAFAHTHGQAFSVKGLNICIEYFKKMGHEVKAVVPQYRLKKDKSTDQKKLEELYKNGDILLAPSKNLPGQKSSSYDDRLIMSVAEKFDGVIISNDNFRDLLAENDSWKKIIETRVAGYTWAMDAFFLPDDPYGRNGPSLAEMLHVKPSATKEK